MQKNSRSLKKYAIGILVVVIMGFYAINSYKTKRCITQAPHHTAAYCGHGEVVAINTQQKNLHKTTIYVDKGVSVTIDHISGSVNCPFGSGAAFCSQSSLDSQYYNPHNLGGFVASIETTSITPHIQNMYGKALSNILGDNEMKSISFTANESGFLSVGFLGIYQNDDDNYVSVRVTLK